VAAVDSAVIQPALALAWPDFEDAVTAPAAGCNLIVTRDPTGFPPSPVTALADRPVRAARLDGPRIPLAALIMKEPDQSLLSFTAVCR
jgi:hypothetical protein